MCVAHGAFASGCAGLSQTPFFEHKGSHLCAARCLDRAVFLEIDAQWLLAELMGRLPAWEVATFPGLGGCGSVLGPQGCTQTAFWGAPHGRCCPHNRTSVIAPEWSVFPTPGVRGQCAPSPPTGHGAGGEFVSCSGRFWRRRFCDWEGRPPRGGEGPRLSVPAGPLS